MIIALSISSVSPRVLLISSGSTAIWWSDLTFSYLKLISFPNAGEYISFISPSSGFSLNNAPVTSPLISAEISCISSFTAITSALTGFSDSLVSSITPDTFLSILKLPSSFFLRFSSKRRCSSILLSSLSRSRCLSLSFRSLTLAFLSSSSMRRLCLSSSLRNLFCSSFIGRSFSLLILLLSISLRALS